MLCCCCRQIRCCAPRFLAADFRSSWHAVSIEGPLLRLHNGHHLNFNVFYMWHHVTAHSWSCDKLEAVPFAVCDLSSCWPLAAVPLWVSCPILSLQYICSKTADRLCMDFQVFACWFRKLRTSWTVLCERAESGGNDSMVSHVGNWTVRIQGADCFPDGLRPEPQRIVSMAGLEADFTFVLEMLRSSSSSCRLHNVERRKPHIQKDCFQCSSSPRQAATMSKEEKLPTGSYTTTMTTNDGK